MNPQELIARAKAEGRSLLEPEAYAVLAAYGIPVLDHRLAASPEEASRMAEEIGFPAAMKVVSPDVIHKSDSGGVKLGIDSPAAAAEAFAAIKDAVAVAVEDARIEGVLIVPMATGGVEVIAGMVRDPQFGPAVMFGLGGIFVEILKDVAFEIAPVSAEEAGRLIKSIKGYPLLAGARGSKPCDLESLGAVITGLSQLALELDEVKEIDLNPVLARPEGARVLDARILL
jgi:acetate---CoA ligase (ADP-forming) subunit beta